MANHVMFRSDSMAGTTLGQFLASLYIDTEIDNGMLVAVGNLKEGQREVKEISAISATTKIGNIAVLGSEEVDEEKAYNSVSDFTNKEGSIARGYILHDNGAYSVTAGAFEGAAPAKGAKIYAKAGSNKHHTASDSDTVEIGVCEDIEVDGATTWYVIRINA